MLSLFVLSYFMLMQSQNLCDIQLCKSSLDSFTSAKPVDRESCFTDGGLSTMAVPGIL